MNDMLLNWIKVFWVSGHENDEQVWFLTIDIGFEIDVNSLNLGDVLNIPDSYFLPGYM